ncbi:unnamed protein product [Closterium sp. NIES-65]|nr:unnamed protein product [Closterium sp. NIES-65]
MTHLQSVVATCQLSLLRFPHNPLIQHRLQQASRQLEQYLSSRAADIAFKAKLKVEGAREMGVPSLLSGLNSHIKASQVSAITLPSGRLTSNLGEITAHCTSFFSNLYGAPPQPARPSDFWHHLPPSSPPSALLLPLQAPFSLAEIDRAMASLAPGKTPGSDGLPGDFFRFYRALLGPVFHQLFASIWRSQLLPPSMRGGRTVLIPKRQASSMVEDLRPITLMNADYKILAICLANRLQPVLRHIIHPAQTAFVRGRSIGDTINDTLDLMEWAVARSVPLLVLTVDIRKAYDLVDREFMYQCLSYLGLPSDFITWVRLLHTDTSTRVLVNNHPGPDFPVRSGVRQGCPLAPLLFICVIEVLHRHLSSALPGFAFSNHQRRLAACYADDISIFLNSDSELHTASQLLDSFALVSGEQPNWNKCSILPFNIPHQQIMHAGPIPVRQPEDAERILGVFVQQTQPGVRTWEQILATASSTIAFLSKLHLTASCRAALVTERVIPRIAFGGRFQPPPPRLLKQLDMLVGNFLSASKHHYTGLVSRLLTKRILYNKKQHGGIGGLEPSQYVSALNVQRACRRFRPTPFEDIARSCSTLPFGLHCFLLHPLILRHLHVSTPARARAELESFLAMSPLIHPPRLEPWVLLAEPLPFNRFLLKPDGQPFGGLKEELPLFTLQLRLGHLLTPTETGLRRLSRVEIFRQFPTARFPCSRRILTAIIEAVPLDWWEVLLPFQRPLGSLAAGDWTVPVSPPPLSPPQLLQVRFPLPGGLVVADRYDISCRRVGREPASCSIVPERSLLTILVRDRWIHGPFCSGAGLADRIDLLRPEPPSLAVLRKQFYRPQPLSIQEAWSTALQIPVPALPSLRHPFLREQPSRPRDLLLRLFARALPTGARFRFMEDGGSCRRCQPRPLETLLHVFNECGPAASVSAALCRVARSHLGVTVPAPLVFFPLSHPAGQIAPWCLLVGAAAKTLWDERCAAVHQRESSSAISILHRVLGAFLSACKLFFWQRKVRSIKFQRATASRVRYAQWSLVPAGVLLGS